MPDDRMLDRFNDKWNFHLFCTQHGINTPPSRLVESKHALDFHAVKTALGTPFVLKPLNEDASKGVCILSSEEECRKNIVENRSYLHAPLIAQRYIDGIDVGLNFLSFRGKIQAMSIQRRVEQGHDGSRIEFFASRHLENAAIVMARESAYHGVMNVDARIERETGNIYLFESNPRFWRSLSASSWCGLNFVELCATAPHDGAMKTLFSGSADTYYHPLFRPALWQYLLFDRSSRGRMVRAMAPDLCTLLMSMRILAALAKRHAKKVFIAALPTMKGDSYERAGSH